MVYGNPISVPKSIDPDENALVVYTKKVENELNRVTAQADAMCGHRFEV
jgi:hypothetical protein